MLKKTCAVLLALIMCMGMVSVTAGAEGQNTAVIMDGKELSAPAQLKGDDMLLPLRAVCEAAGYKVEWTGVEDRIVLNKPGKTINLRINDNNAAVNEHQMFLTVLPVLIDDKTYIGTQFASDEIGLCVDWDKAANVISIKSSEENSITLSTEKINSDTDTLTLNIQYPKVEGLQNPAAQEKINSAIVELAQNAKATAEKTEKEMLADNLYRYKVDEYFNYTVKLNELNLLSIKFDDYIYTGGAHGSTIVRSLTFDLETGDVYGLKDLFNENADYISAINAEIKKQIVEKDYKDAFIVDFESIKPDQDYYLNDNGLVIYFQRYEYTPYVFGSPEFVISPSLLESMLKAGNAAK